MRLELRCICKAALDDLCNAAGGDAGGELAMVSLSSEDGPEQTRNLSSDLVLTNLVYRTDVHFAFVGFVGFVGGGNGLEGLFGRRWANRGCVRGAVAYDEYLI